MHSSLSSCRFSIDEVDSNCRGKERLKWRRERWSKRPRSLEDDRNPYGLEDIDADRSVIETEKFLGCEDGALLECKFLSKPNRLRVKYPSSGTASGDGSIGGRSVGRKRR